MSTSVIILRNAWGLILRCWILANPNNETSPYLWTRVYTERRFVMIMTFRQ